jgi:hypothetical protein
MVWFSFLFARDGIDRREREGVSAGAYERLNLGIGDTLVSAVLCLTIGDNLSRDAGEVEICAANFG